jgi:hypothetical protein
MFPSFRTEIKPEFRIRIRLVFVTPYSDRGQIQRKTWCKGPYTGVDYYLTLCPLQSRLQNIYHGQPYAIVDLDPMPESTVSPQSGTLDLASEFRIRIRVVFVTLYSY